MTVGEEVCLVGLNQQHDLDLQNRDIHIECTAALDQFKPFSDFIISFFSSFPQHHLQSLVYAQSRNSSSTVISPSLIEYLHRVTSPVETNINMTNDEHYIVNGDRSFNE